LTKWGFHDVLPKGAATILQPHLCHAGLLKVSDADQEDR
jgi:hypothetical protein